jgi:hypothetical protein
VRHAFLLDGDSHSVPRVRYFPVARQVVARLLVEPVPDVGVLSLAQPPSGDVAGLVEVVPGEAAVGRFQTLQGHGDGGTRGRVVAVLRHRHSLLQS